MHSFAATASVLFSETSLTPRIPLPAFCLLLTKQGKHEIDIVTMSEMSQVDDAALLRISLNVIKTICLA